MTLPSHPFDVNTRSLTAFSHLVDELRLYSSRGFPFTVRLIDADIPFNVDANNYSALVLPAWLATEDGWVLRWAALLVGSDKRTSAAGATLSVTVQLRSTSGAVSLGSFSTTSNDAVVGTPFMLTGAQPVDRAIPRGSSIEVFVEQTGSPIVTCADATVCGVLARTGA